MSIRFVCVCGKHLRAHDEMAARRSVCPECGRPVGIPSQQPTQRGTEAEPLSLTDNPVRVEQPASANIPAGDFLRYRVVALPDGSVPVRVPRDDELTYRVVPLQDEKLPPTRQAREPKTLEAEFAQSDERQLDHGDRRWRRVLDADLSRIVKRKNPDRRSTRRARGWQLERYWFQSLAYPFRAWLIIGALAFVSALLVSQIAVAMPWYQEHQTIAPLLILPAMLAGVLAYACAFFHCTALAAVSGDAGVVRWPGADLALVLQGVARCLVCFLAGPALLVLAAFLFWYDAGDLEGIDQVILAELIVVAAGYWLFAFLAVSEKDRLSAVTPLAVAGIINRLKLRSLFAVLVLSLVVAGHALWTSDALPELHHDGFSSWFSLLLCWGNTFFWLTFLLRWLGVSSFRSRAQAAAGGEGQDATVTNDEGR